LKEPTHIRHKLRLLFAKDEVLVFCCSLTIIFGLSFFAWITFRLEDSVDPKTYWGLANFDFEQSPIRKYRILQPFSIAGVHWLLLKLVRLFRPDSSGVYIMRLCFYVFNLLASSALSTLTFRYVKIMGRSRFASFVAAIIMATCICTINNTSAFMVDSLYCCMLLLTFMAIETNNARLLFWCIILAPFAKESYLFVLPVVFWACRIDKLKLFSWVVLSAVITFSYRYIFDLLTGHPMSDSLNEDVEHFTFIISNSKRLVETGYLFPTIGILSLWILVPIGGILLMKGFWNTLRSNIRSYMVLWFFLVLLQMLMSGDIPRMAYLYLPMIAYFVAITIDAWRKDRVSLAE
jgi:hypothetical protein